MLRRVPRTTASYVSWTCVVVLLLCAIFGGERICQAASAMPPVATSRLVALAARRFPNLSNAERAMLWFSDVDNVDRAEFAVAGTSSNPDDPSNDPAHADEWPASRQIRSSLIRWICVDYEARNLIDPEGIRVVGARIAGGLDLSLVNVPFPIVLRNCVFTEIINLAGAEIADLELDGSHTLGIRASGLVVRNNLRMSKGSQSVGAVVLDHAKIGLDLDFGGATLRYAKSAGDPFPERLRATLFAYLISVGGNVWLNHRFISYGAVDLGGARIGGNLHFDSGRFINPNNVAIAVPGASVDGVVYLAGWGKDGDVEVTGVANFSFDRVANNFIVDHAKFLGALGDNHGFVGTSMSVMRSFTWRNVILQNGARLDLRDASVEALLDDEQSWPAPGNLVIDGFTYNGLESEAGSRVDGPTRFESAERNAVDSRLRWLALQPPGFYSQPYNELAKYYSGTGDDAAAAMVLVAEEDDRYQRMGLLGRLSGDFLRATIGYGHRPLLAFNWSILVVLIGWVVVMMGKRAGVMRLTWPENSPPPTTDQFNGLHPLLYSLDVFLPFVNLHQEHYWWPDEGSKGQCTFAGRTITIRGSSLRLYLWMQIIAGWLLSAIFVAGITGLIRNH
jgi:hypothetical protein